MGSSSCGYGGWDMLWYTIWNLENQESRSDTKGLRTLGAAGASAGVQTPANKKLHCLSTAGVGCPGLKKREKICPSCASYSIHTLDGLNDAHPHWCGWVFFISLVIQMLNSSRNVSTATLRNTVVPAIWAYLSPVKLTHTINHHNDNAKEFALDFQNSISGFWLSYKHLKHEHILSTRYIFSLAFCILVNNITIYPTAHMGNEDSH